MLATTAKQSRCENGRGGSGDQHELPSRQDVERADVPERHSPERRAILVLRDLEGVPETSYATCGPRACRSTTSVMSSRSAPSRPIDRPAGRRSGPGSGGRFQGGAGVGPCEVAGGQGVAQVGRGELLQQGQAFGAHRPPMATGDRRRSHGGTRGTPVNAEATPRHATRRWRRGAASPGPADTAGRAPSTPRPWLSLAAALLVVYSR